MQATFILYILAAFACAVCNGAAAVLQKVGADTQKITTSFTLKFATSLLRNWPYVLGIFLDVAAWIFTLIAVHGLPLFVVQPIIAFSVVITVFIERFAFKRRLGRKTIFAIGLIIIGLLAIALQSTVEHSMTIRGVGFWIIILAPLFLGIIGTVLVKVSARYATVALAAVAGTAFGSVAISGRILNFSQPYWHIVYSPVFLALIVYGLVGIATFTVALQRERASVVTAAMITFETLIPIAVGAKLLGDVPKNGSWFLVVIGASIAAVGTIVISISNTDEPNGTQNSVEQ
ncbi:DMT family transporter [Candidatus Saccharibacteria bacterium]|nr:DMT family transporter [Candidatus Saccharibacteria bacterium]